MFTIGEFANLGRVSVRMLRHYGALGLLAPATVDAATGYRYYTAAQLGRLNRIIALKDLGLSLRDVGDILHERVDLAELRGMLRLRRTELAAQVAADTFRLAGVEARLRIIESEGHMNDIEVVVKPLPPVRVAELVAVAAGYGPEHISPVVGPLFPQLFAGLAASGITPTGPTIAWYESDPHSDGVVVHAGVPVPAGATPADPVSIVDLPEAADAATVIHTGAMSTVMSSLQVLAQWIEDHGYRPVGYHREVYLHHDPVDQNNWVTEVQVAITR